ncbi:MAG: FAD-dependent oxidoreductase [Anaerolineae bacterium]
MSRLTVVGAGLAGTLAALFMARRGLPVSLYERRPDPRRVAQPAGRSINLALANRGLKPLEAAGLAGQVRPLLTVMRGRMVHDREGGQDLQPYGQQDGATIGQGSSVPSHEHGIAKEAIRPE